MYMVNEPVIASLPLESLTSALMAAVNIGSAHTTAQAPSPFSKQGSIAKQQFIYMIQGREHF